MADLDRTWEPPRHAPLRGSRVTLVPLDLDAHAAALFHAAGADPHLWDFLPSHPPADEPALRAIYAPLLADPDVLPFTVCDGDAPAGVVTYLRLRPAHGAVEIGHIWFAGHVQRTPVGTEAAYLLAEHVLGELGYRRLEWKCDARNARSRAAAERLGFTYEGTFRQDLVVKGVNRDTAWFSLLDHEWPRARAALRTWLDAAATGERPPSLASLRD